jgi:hypothetical protein
MEASSLLTAVIMHESRLDFVIRACLNTHDQALRSAANSVLLSLCQVMQEQKVLYVLNRVHSAMSDEANVHAAFDLLSCMVTAVKKERYGAEKLLMMHSGVHVAEATLLLCCQAAASPLACGDTSVFDRAMEALMELLRASSNM